MEIKKATEKDIEESIKIASNLKDWFTGDAIVNMVVDFNLNNVIVVKEEEKVIGFLCYTSFSGKMLLMWMGVDTSGQRKGIGQSLLKWLEEESRKIGLSSIEVETLTDKDNYEPYKLTREFYYKNGFEKVGYKKSRIEGWDDQIILEKKLI